MTIKVLVVDDTRVIRNSIKDFFDKDFFDIVGEASDGFEALEAYKEYRPDIVTMDMNMPGCDGVRAIKMIMEEDANAYIIIISSMDEAIVAGLEAGAKACIFKPISMTKFREAMGQVFIAIGKRKEEFGSGEQDDSRSKRNENDIKSNDVNKLRTNSKYEEGVKHNLQMKGWDKEVVYKFFWSTDKMILEIRKDPTEKVFNKLVERIKIIKANDIEIEIVCGKLLDGNMKINFLRMLLL